MIEKSDEEEWYGMCEINKSEQSNGIQIYMSASNLGFRPI